MRAFLVTSIIAFAILISVVDMDAHPKDSTNKKNLIELSQSIHNYLDATSPDWQRRSLKRLGMAYTRSICGRHSARLAYYRFYAYLSAPIDAPEGRVVERNYRVFSLGYLYDLYNRDPIRVQGVAELNYRYGSELLHIYYGGGEQILEGVATDDIGLSVGPAGSIPHLELCPLIRAQILVLFL